MGLDMYLYKVDRTPESVIAKINGKHTDDFPNTLWVFNASDVEDKSNFNMFKDLMPYLTKVDAVSTYYDLLAIKRDNGIPEDAYITGESYSGHKTGFTFRWNAGYVNGSKSVSIGDGEYLIDRQHSVYVCTRREIAYWRKAYEVQNYIYQNYDNGQIENCGYHLLNPELLHDMVDNGYLSEVIFCNEGNEYDFENVFYHEWY